MSETVGKTRTRRIADENRQAPLRALDVTVGYQHEILSGLSMAIEPGTITALIGANGCGKSTLLRALAHILVPQGGQVLLEGTEISRYTRREIARKLSMLPQSPRAPEELTVRELCRFGRQPHRRFWGGGGQAEDERIVQWALEQTNMDQLSEQHLEHLSGGQRQRAWIAMTLAQGSSLMLLDEPTTYLDIAHQVEILRLLRTLNREQGTTIVMVVHDINHAARYADHVIALGEGGVVADGPVREVLTAETVSAVFGIPCVITAHPVDGSPLCLLL